MNHSTGRRQLPLPGTGGLILCGGQSSRMGRNKAQLRFGPQTLLERVTGRMAAVTAPVVISLGPKQVIANLGDDILIARDSAPGQGPFSGLAAGFRLLAGQCRRVVVMTVDLPFFDETWISRLAGELGDGLAVVCRYEGFTTALIGAYSMDLLPVLDRMEQAGERRPMRLVKEAGARVITVEEIWSPAQGPPPLMDVDTPDDYREALAWEGIGNREGAAVTVHWEAGGCGAETLHPLPLYADTPAQALAFWVQVYPETAETAGRLREVGRAWTGDAGVTLPVDWSTPLLPGQRVRFVN